MNKKKNTGGSGAKLFIIGLILVIIVIGYYYYLSNKNHAAEEEEVEMTVVQEMLSYNFERDYPPTPKEVVKLYAEMTQCLYNEEYTDEEFGALAMQIRRMYDDELAANTTEAQYLEDLQWDVNNFKTQEIVISSFATSSSTDVEEFTRDGFRFAKLYCTFTLRQGNGLGRTYEVFLLRKDDEGHWKIYGFQLADQNE